MTLPEPLRRWLLVHSDAQPGPSGSRSLAGVRLPSGGFWALTATWPAEDAPRPGSVWSHTLLLDADSVTSLAGVASLLAAIRRPEPNSDFDAYRKPLAIADRPLKLAVDDIDLAEGTLLAFYGWPTRQVAVLTERIAASESALMALWQQQWPELRLETSFATRSRIGEDATVSIQVAAGRSRKSDQGPFVLELGAVQPNPSWLPSLVSDLCEPSALRNFLWRYGPEAARGRAEVPSLSRIRSELLATPASSAFESVVRSYPTAPEMDGLKFDCLSRDGTVWVASEGTRVEAALLSIDAVAWSRLAIPQRVRDLWRSEPERAAAVTQILFRRKEPKRLLSETLKTTGEVADAEVVGRLGLLDARLAAAVLVRARDLLTSPDLWRESAPWQQATIRSIRGTRRKVNVRSLVELLFALDRTDLIFGGLNDGAFDLQTVTDALVSHGATARALREWEHLPYPLIDAAADAAAESEWVLDSALLAAAVPSDSRERLLRLRGVELAQTLDQAEEPVRALVAAALLARATKAHGDRRAIASRTFPVLHKALVKGTLPQQAQTELDTLLPPGAASDRARRLRRLLLNIIKQEGWTVEEVSDLVSRAGPESAELRKEAGKRSELRRLLDAAWEGVTWWE